MGAAASMSQTPSSSPTAGMGTGTISFARPSPNASTLLSVAGTPATLPSAGAFSPGPLVAGLFLALLAAAALLLARRRRRVARIIDILESASLGPKRSLVIARLGDELLVLGSSEGGIALLSTRPAAGLLGEFTRSPGAVRAAPSGEPPPEARESAAEGLRRSLRAAGVPAPQEREPSSADPRPAPRSATGRVLDLLARLWSRTRPPAPPRFEAALTESLEDVELRRKLAAGLTAQANLPPSLGAPRSVP
jgi:flagellar protein FliO/FliZ